MKSIKILLVDDDRNNYILTQELLAPGILSNKYILNWCTTYSDAINSMLKDRYDLYLVDHKIGKNSGLRLLMEAVKSNCTKPIIMLTGRDDKEIDEEALQAGAADYLTKDQLTGETLERSIRYAIRQFETFEKLKRNEHKFRVLFERSKDAILITDPSGRIRDANKSALQFFGMEYADMTEVNCAFFYLHPSERQAFVKILQRDGVVNDMQIELITLNGDVRTCSVTSFIEIPQHGDSELFYTFVKDIPETPGRAHSIELFPTLSHLKTQLPLSLKAVRTSLSKISQAIESRVDPDIHSEDSLLFDTIRMNASFADQALHCLEEDINHSLR